MDYDLIVPSASRPHLLETTLVSLLGYVDHLPGRIIIHNDEVFPDKTQDILTILDKILGTHIPWTWKNDQSPLGHGPSLAWLLNQTTIPYVLYTQDDFVTLRSLPIRETLACMETHGLHHVRFNKRKTMPYKGEGETRWYKREVQYGETPLVVSDHWYFQTSLWRVAQIKPVVDWWMGRDPVGFKEHGEIKINNGLNSVIWVTGDYQRPPKGSSWDDSQVREHYQRTFIYGHIGDPPYVKHIGDHPEDYALIRNRSATS